MARAEEIEEREFAPLELPSADDIREFVLGTESSRRLGRLPDFVVRSNAEAASWAVDVVHREFDDLLTTFVSTEKSFYVAFVNILTTKKREIGFRLTTKGLGGYSEYVIVFCRVTPDQIACLDCA
jgi:hypothetical protein